MNKKKIIRNTLCLVVVFVMLAIFMPAEMQGAKSIRLNASDAGADGQTENIRDKKENKVEVFQSNRSHGKQKRKGKSKKERKGGHYGESRKENHALQSYSDKKERYHVHKNRRKNIESHTGEQLFHKGFEENIGRRRYHHTYGRLW